MKSIWKNCSFVYVWSGNMISELGGAFGTFCNSIMVYQLTGSTMALSSMWLLYFIPSLILQLFIGPFIDRWSRKWIMIFSQWTRAAVFLVPLLAWSAGHLEVWHIFFVQIVVGLITPLYVPANHAITPTIVPNEQLKQANALIESTVRLMSFMAPLIGGLVIEYIGINVTLLFVIVALGLSGGLLWFVKEPSPEKVVRSTWWKEFGEGIAFFFKQRVVVWLGFFLAFVQFGVGVTMVTTLPYITGELQASYAGYGYFMAGFPVGYILGAFLIGRIPYRSPRFIMLGALGIGGLTFVGLGLNESSLIVAIVLEVIAGVVMAIFSINNTTLCQRIIPNHLMGKIFSVRLLIIRGVMPLGVLVGGLLGEVWGVRPLYFLIGSMITAVALVGLFFPYFRFIDREMDERKVS
ncbi:permease [Bacillus sp. LL01]|uniref:MFS transporter n=1 Tax=Bacillus sp. LL01 TaxID=1665556 RepID=UPI00064D07DE|nr:MFS transporter [Bacillus sp. LL01]KMJ57275.1 permease [Bacillus sp. LL01]